MAHPALVIEHQYAITETIPELAGKVGDGERVPVLRDLKGSSYVRQVRTPAPTPRDNKPQRKRKPSTAQRPSRAKTKTRRARTHTRPSGPRAG
eukprot:4685448-Prymnesium_polylepis.1